MSKELDYLEVDKYVKASQEYYQSSSQTLCS